MYSKFGPFPLATLVDMWSKDGMLKIAEGDINVGDTNSFISFVSDVSEEVSVQLHSGIMKAARRMLLDEIISGVIPEFFASKKARRHIMREETSKDAKIYSNKEVTYLLDAREFYIMTFSSR